ncbi:hypothetical protein Q8W38_11505 [Vibrio splendidus]|uniref:Exonuclease SbcC n=1 Tax=Vibrio splendidus TaxID=29497 RepID=A0ABD5A9W5_VIBSP|nr:MULTISPECIES: hypothetical protein [Vibrio]MDP2489964.1 hypothetical protein [Vibrio splendidus]PMI12703.1 hypothetical protein BCU53_03715 [Vibrio lentus]PMK87337.1 hypothetical protein BCT90_00900 [Vibrio lentus]
MAEYDERNKEQYDLNTKKIEEALLAIRKDKKLKATKKQLVDLTGLHRNTFDSKGSRSWVSQELEIIKSIRQEQPKLNITTEKKKEDNLQKLLDQSKLEILHWFTKYSESERELDKLRHRLKRDNDSLEWYKAELVKGRKSQVALEERIELLESLLSSKNNGA